jgi:hypothetical protein
VSCAAEVGGCAPKPYTRNWKLLERIGSDRWAAGKTVCVKFREMDAMREGRHVHIRAIRIVSTVAIAAAGSPSNEARTHHFLRSLLENIVFSDSEGHKYFDGLDGRSLHDHAFFDRSMYCLPAHLAYAPGTLTALEGLTTDDASGVSARVTWEIDLAGRVGDQTERLIPLAALQARDAEALSFKLRSSLPNPDSDSYGAITYTQPTDPQSTAGAEVWVDTIELPGVNVPPRWFVREYERRESGFRLDHPEATHLYAVVRYRAEDKLTSGSLVGEALVTGLDKVTVRVGGSDLESNTARLELLNRDIATMESEPRSWYGEAQSALNLPRETGSSSSIGFMGLLLPRPREFAPAGPAIVKFGAFSPEGFVRILHCGVLCADGSRDAKILAAAKMQGAQGFQQRSDGALATVSLDAKADATGATMYAKG